MFQLKILPIIAACLLLSCATLSLAGCTNEEDEFHNFAKALSERRGSGWPIPDNVDALVGVYTYDLTAEEVQKIGLSAVTDISDCEAVMEFYQNGNGRIALYDERSKGSNPTSAAYDLEWYAEKTDAKDLDIDIDQNYTDCYLVQIAFYQHFDIEFKGEYTFIQSANDSYIHEKGTARYEHAKDWFIIKNTDSAEDESLMIPTIKLEE